MVAVAVAAMLVLTACERTSPPSAPASSSATTPTPKTTPPTKPQTPNPVTTNTYTGTLKGHIAAIGGESTGWALLYIEELENESLEVVVDAVADQAAALEGKRVIVKGDVFKMKLVERGEVDRIRVKSIEVHPVQPAKTVTPGATGLPTSIGYPH